jgi:hypothetical protein
MKIQIILLFIHLTNCSLQAQFSKQGYALISWKYYDTSKKQYLPTFNEAQVWYKDSIAIRPQYSIFDSTMNDIPVLRRVDTLNYYYINLKKRYCYEYDSFNTSSNFYKSYTLNDSMKKETSFSYLFLGCDDSLQNIKMPDEDYEKIADTLIGNIKFWRLKCVNQFNRNGKHPPTVWIAYFRYDIPKSIMHLSRKFDDKIGWPMVMLEVYDVQFRTLIELRYVRSKLTKQELAIFNAWEKNAKEHPVIHK